MSSGNKHDLQHIINAASDVYLWHRCGQLTLRPLSIETKAAPIVARHISETTYYADVADWTYSESLSPMHGTELSGTMYAHAATHYA